MDNKDREQNIQLDEIKHPIILDYTLSFTIGLVVLILGFFIGFVVDNYLKTTSYNAKLKPINKEIQINSEDDNKYLMWINEALEEYYKDSFQLKKKSYVVNIKHLDGQSRSIKFNIGSEDKDSYIIELLFKFEKKEQEIKITDKSSPILKKETNSGKKDRLKQLRRSDLNLAEEFRMFLQVPEISLLKYIFCCDPDKEKEYFKYLILDSCEKRKKDECLNAFKANIKRTLKLLVPDFQK